LLTIFYIQVIVVKDNRWFFWWEN